MVSTVDSVSNVNSPCLGHREAEGTIRVSGPVYDTATDRALPVSLDSRTKLFRRKTIVIQQQPNLLNQPLKKPWGKVIQVN